MCQSRGNTTILIIYIPMSWNKPHMVIFSGHYKFYIRNSAGKHPMNVDDLRSSFTHGQNIIHEIENFIIKRNASIFENDSFIPLGEKGKLAFYLLPIQAINSNISYDVINTRPDEIPTIYSSGYNPMINLEGFLSYYPIKDERSLASYTQLYRNGIIEAVNDSLLSGFQGNQKIIPSLAYEQELIYILPKYFKIYTRLGIDSPIGITISFINIRGYSFAVDSKYNHFHSNLVYSRDILKLPIKIVDNLTQSPEKILKPLFDLVWNAFGFKRSFNYNEQGDWVKEKIS